MPKIMLTSEGKCADFVEYLVNNHVDFALKFIEEGLWESSDLFIFGCMQNKLNVAQFAYNLNPEYCSNLHSIHEELLVDVLAKGYR